MSRRRSTTRKPSIAPCHMNSTPRRAGTASSPQAPRSAASQKSPSKKYTTYAHDSSSVINGDFRGVWNHNPQTQPMKTKSAPNILRRVDGDPQDSDTPEEDDQAHYATAFSAEPEGMQADSSTAPREEGQGLSRPRMPDHAATFPLDAHSRFLTKVPMPDGLRSMFKGFIPYLVDLAGVQEDPWNIDDEVIFTQWIGYTKRVLKQAPGDEALRPLIISNSQYQLGVWRDSIAKRALLHLTDALDALPTPEDRREWIMDRLYVHDTSPRCLPLYFRKVKSSKGLRVRVDIYQAPIVASAFSLHLHSIENVPQHLRMPTMAIGALILSLQASLRAAEFWRSGQLTSPPHRPFEEINEETSYHNSQIKMYEEKGKPWDDVIRIARRYMVEEDPRDYRLLNPNDAEEELLPDDSDSDSGSESNSG